MTSSPPPRTTAPPTVTEMADRARRHLTELTMATRAVDAATSPEDMFDAACHLWSATEELRADTGLRVGARAAMVAAGHRTGRGDRQVADAASRHRPVGESRLRQYIPAWRGTIGTRGSNGFDDG